MPKKIAYVLDDDDGLRTTLLRMLSAHDYQPRGFAFPAPMLKALEETAADIVVLDLALGQSDAVEVMRQLATLKYRGNVLLISGRDQTLIKECQRIGGRYGLAMLDGLSKPFRSSDLLERLVTPSVRSDTPLVPCSPGPAKIDISTALECGWLELWYQPKIDLRTFSVCGAEALLRGRHPQHGIVPPALILPALGDPLHELVSRFVIQRAISDWDCFSKAGMSLKLSVNMPVSVLTALHFITFLRTVLPTDPGFPGLIIEVTEDEMIKDANWIHEVSTQLNLLGVGISIDDFGTAYSSLSRLLELPCVELKLDRSFVSNCSANRLKRALCQTVVDLAHRVGSVVCAEGVETVADLDAILAMGCDTVQGFVFARPMPYDIFLAEVIANKKNFSDRFVGLHPSSPVHSVAHNR
jgi:EAL domain-containing protein (putative c-di-GMP-specific phosphodiesterase class I)